MVRWSVIVVAVVALTACGESSVARSGDEPIRIVAAENFWGDIAAQLGGRYVAVTSIISDPTADPHLYESDARTAAAIEGANFDIWNGQGYDDFFTDVLDSSMRAGGHTLRVDRVLRVTGDDANPHLWYDVPRVGEVARAIVDILGQEDPAHKAAFAANLAEFDASLRPVLDALDAVEAQHRGAPVAYTERVAGYLLDAAGLSVRSPPGFARAIEEGNEPSARDTKAMNDLIAARAVDVLLYNAQATSPVTEHIKDLARRARIPVVGMTETMPAGDSYQTWMLHQVQALAAALNQ